MASYVLYRTAAFLARVLPRCIIDRISISIAYLFYLFRHTIRKNVRANLEILEITGARPFDVFKNFARATTDFLILSSGKGEGLVSSCRLNGKDILDRVLKGGKGALLIAPHIGPWEVAGAHLASSGYSIHTVALGHQSARVTRFFSANRKKWGIEDYEPDSSTAKLLRSLRAGEVVVLFIDRNFGVNGIDLTFFDRSVNLPYGHIVLSKRSGAPMIPCCCFYTGDGAVEIVIDEPVESDTQVERKPMNRIGSECLERVENSIRAHYEQWFAFDHLWME